MEKILIIDDNSEIQNQLKWGLKKEYHVISAAKVDKAMELFKRHAPPVVTLDLGLPPDPDGVSEGFKCLRALLEINPSTKVIVITGKGEKGNALKAIDLGAYDFYCKPIELPELKVILSRAFHLGALEEENRILQKSVYTQSSMGEMLGSCPQMQVVFRTIEKVAPSDAPVLIVGESGTGKELVARAVHACSQRKEGRFVPINCGAIPENLLESELFGFERGAFTGAHERVIGKVEQANGGSLFLDEIGELPTQLQVKLLRFLQEKVIERLGGRRLIPADARIIAATNIDLHKAITEKTFREDLYYRIGVITIQLPPLREREKDLFLLANYFLQKYRKEFGRGGKGFSMRANEKLGAHLWPGNIRELENRVKRAVIMADGAIIEPEDLGFELDPSEVEDSNTAALLGEDGFNLKEARDKLELRFLILAMEREQGNIARAAKLIGVSRPTFYDLIHKHGIRHDENR